MPYSADPRASYIQMEINMTWVEMSMNDFGKTIKYLGDEGDRYNSEGRLGLEIERKVQDYIQRKLFWNREEALEKYKDFETVWHLIEDVVYEFAKKNPDLVELQNESGCAYCEEEAIGTYGFAGVSLCKEHRDRAGHCGTCGWKKPDECDCDDE
jgi:hypothetical protein